MSTVCLRTFRRIIGSSFFTSFPVLLTVPELHVNLKVQHRNFHPKIGNDIIYSYTDSLHKPVILYMLHSFVSCTCSHFVSHSCTQHVLNSSHQQVFIVFYFVVSQVKDREFYHCKGYIKQFLKSQENYVHIHLVIQTQKTQSISS